jgi:hypothetical protein
MCSKARFNGFQALVLFPFENVTLQKNQVYLLAGMKSALAGAFFLRF